MVSNPSDRRRNILHAIQGGAPGRALPGLLAWLPLLLLPPLARAAGSPSKKGDLYILGIALNQLADPKNGVTMASYNWCPEEVVKVFREQGRSLHRQIHTRLILAQKATHANALGGLAWLRQHTTP